jgi:hypothetical protein
MYGDLPPQAVALFVNAPVGDLYQLRHRLYAQPSADSTRTRRSGETRVIPWIARVLAIFGEHRAGWWMALAAFRP